MHTHIHRHMFTQIVDSYIHQFHCIQGTAAFLRVTSSMGRPSLKMVFNRMNSGADAVGSPGIPSGMPGQCTVQLTEGTLSGHESLSRQHLLCRAAIKYQGSTYSLLFHFLFCCHGTACHGYRQKVMATSMSKCLSFNRLFVVHIVLALSRQCVIFPQKSNYRAPLTIYSPDCRRYSAASYFHRKTVFLKKISTQPAGMVLPVWSLRILPDRSAHVAQTPFLPPQFLKRKIT